MLRRLQSVPTHPVFLSERFFEHEPPRGFRNSWPLIESKNMKLHRWKGRISIFYLLFLLFGKLFHIVPKLLGKHDAVSLQDITGADLIFYRLPVSYKQRLNSLTYFHPKKGLKRTGLLRSYDILRLYQVLNRLSLWWDRVGGLSQDTWGRGGRSELSGTSPQDY